MNYNGNICFVISNNGNSDIETCQLKHRNMSTQLKISVVNRTLTTEILTRCITFQPLYFLNLKRDQKKSDVWKFLLLMLYGSSFDTTVTKLRRAGGRPFGLKSCLMWQNICGTSGKNQRAVITVDDLLTQQGGTTWKECDFPHPANKKSKECICNQPQGFSLSPGSPPPKEKIFRFNILTTRPQAWIRPVLLWIPELFLLSRKAQGQTILQTHPWNLTRPTCKELDVFTDEYVRN